MQKKVFSWWWHNRWRHRVASKSAFSILHYIWNNKRFHDNKNRAKISSLNFLCICIMRLWLHLYKCVFIASLVTSTGHGVGQILILIYLRQYLSHSINQKLKMSEMRMAIFRVNSISGMYSGKKNVASSKWRPFQNFEISNTASIGPQIWSDCPKLCQKYFSWWWRHRWCHRVSSKFPSIVLFRSLAPGASCNGDVSSIDANMVIVFLGYTCQKTISRSRQTFLQEVMW